MRRALNVVKRIFTVRSCHYALPAEIPGASVPRLLHQALPGPVRRLPVARPTTGCMIDEVVWFLEGRTAEVVRRVRDRMLEASERLDFERAGELRDALRHLEKMEEPTVVLEVEGGDRDVVGYARDGEDACVVVMRIRGGKLLARDHRLLEHAEGEEDGAVLGRKPCAVVPHGGRARRRVCWCPSISTIAMCWRRRSAAPRIRVPQRGPRRALVDLADQNARHLLEEFKLASLEADERAADPGVRTAARTRPAARAARDRVLRHLARAGHRRRWRAPCGSRTRARSGPSTASSRSPWRTATTISRRCTKW